jgi:hypothetical protein
MLKRVLAANSSWCREGPRINLGHGLARTNESRAWPGVAILIRRGGQPPWDLGRLRVGVSAARSAAATDVFFMPGLTPTSTRRFFWQVSRHP